MRGCLKDKEMRSNFINIKDHRLWKNFSSSGVTRTIRSVTLLSLLVSCFCYKLRQIYNFESNNVTFL